MAWQIDLQDLELLGEYRFDMELLLLRDELSTFIAVLGKAHA